MLIPKTFYRGFPADGAVSGGVGDPLGARLTKINVFTTGAVVPTYKKWRISQITVNNLSQVTGYYSVAIFPLSVGNPVQTDMGLMNADTLPKSANTTGTYGTYLAYSEPIPPADTMVMPIEAWALGDEQIWVGAYPGQISLVGLGAVCITVSGWEYRD